MERFDAIRAIGNAYTSTVRTPYTIVRTPVARKAPDAAPVVIANSSHPEFVDANGRENVWVDCFECDYVGYVAITRDDEWQAFIDKTRPMCHFCN